MEIFIVSRYCVVVNLKLVNCLTYCGIPGFPESLEVHLFVLIQSLRNSHTFKKILWILVELF